MIVWLFIRFNTQLLKSGYVYLIKTKWLLTSELKWTLNPHLELSHLLGTENSDRSTWASTSTRSTRLWLQPRERRWTEVWPTGRESTSQRKSTPQLKTTAKFGRNIPHKDRFRHLEFFFCPFEDFYLVKYPVFDLWTWLLRRSAVSHGPGRSKPSAGSQPRSRGGHGLLSGRRHRVVSGTDERRRPRRHRWDSLCEGRHRAALPLRAWSKALNSINLNPEHSAILNTRLKTEI